MKSLFKWRLQILISALLAAILVGCGPQAFVHPKMEEDPPKVILVLPPENTTANTEVLEKSYPYIFSSLNSVQTTWIKLGADIIG